MCKVTRRKSVSRGAERHEESRENEDGGEETNANSAIATAPCTGIRSTVQARVPDGAQYKKRKRAANQCRERGRDGREMEGERAGAEGGYA